MLKENSEGRIKDDLHETSGFASDRLRSVLSKAQNMTSVILTLPYPPSVNVYWRKRGKVTYLSQRGRLFKTAVAEYVAQHNIMKFGSSEVEVMIVLRPRRKAGFMDIDNCCKAVLDSCQDAGVFDDDNQVTKLTVERGTYIKGGACVVVVLERKHDVQ